jgi:diacylglycerol O-acyltransferase / wax synthase
MQRLCGIDAYAIYSETSTSPFVTLKVAIYKPSDESDVPDVSEIRRFVKADIAMPASKGAAAMRIVRVPLDLHHPVWVADPHFSVEDHIHHVALPSPGGKRELCDFLSDLMGMPLDPDRPLWEIWIVEGLQHGRIAVAVKIHHSLADGKTVVAQIARTHSKTDADRAQTAGFPREPFPGKSRLVRDALLDLFRSFTVDLPRYRRHLKQARGHSASGANAGEHAAKPFSAPHTILNEKGGPYRVYRYETFSLADFKSLSKLFDCSINTLVLGVCSEALKRYLQEVDTLPSIPLTTAMPIGDHCGGDLEMLSHGAIHNNNVAVAVVPLHQDIADFRQRLQAIKRSSLAGIDSVRQSEGRRFDNYLDFLPGAFIRLINAAMDRRQAKKQNPYVNVVISNVAGPGEILRALDGRLEMVELLSTGNLMDAGNLNITVWSYADNLCFSFYSRKGVLPEPDKINGHLRDAVDELRDQYLEQRPLASVHG